ncbi:MAG: DUF5518 domain-containing protein [Methanosarcinales archaeon]|nr:DUF5518 domain-containing protein [Methanosarcinales archaeon]
MVDFNKLQKPVLISGIPAGLISVIPFIHCLCCVWLILFGFLSAYLFKKDTGTLEIEDGVISGALTGLVAFVIMMILSIIFIFFKVGISPLMGEDMAMQGIMSGFSLLFILFTGLIQIIVFPIFGAIGGIIGAVLLKDKELSEQNPR